MPIRTGRSRHNVRKGKVNIMVIHPSIKPHIDDNGIFHYDAIERGIWYAMSPKPGQGARAIPTVNGLIQKFNEVMKSEQKSEADFITSYTPTYRSFIQGGKIATRYVFPSMVFIHTTPTILNKFIASYPYQLFFVRDHSVTPDTNTNEYGEVTGDTHMRISNKAIGELFLTLDRYNGDIKVFTAEELQSLKYTRQVEIVDGPLAGQICRIKTIEGKKRVIIQLFEGLIGMALVMPTTHFKMLK